MSTRQSTAGPTSLDDVSSRPLISNQSEAQLTIKKSDKTRVDDMGYQSACLDRNQVEDQSEA